MEYMYSGKYVRYELRNVATTWSMNNDVEQDRPKRHIASSKDGRR